MLTHPTPTGSYDGGCLNRTLDNKPHSNFSSDPIVFSGLLPTAAQQESSLPSGLSSLGISSDAMPTQSITGQATDSWSHQLKRRHMLIFVLGYTEICGSLKLMNFSELCTMVWYL